MIYAGDCIRAERIGDGCVELVLDRREGEVNQLDRQTLTELRFAVQQIGFEHRLAGVLITSSKEGFMVGADLSEFRSLFSLPRAAMAAELRSMNEALVALEELDVPTVAAINGYALGGGLELALAAALRVLSADVKLGLPEVGLGLIPAFGGTVRLPRLAGMAIARDWLQTGRHFSAQAALDAGVADATSEGALLRDSALEMLRRAIAGQVAWRARQEHKRQPMRVGATNNSAAPTVPSLSPPPDPAAVQTMAEVLTLGQSLHREQALEIEADAFAALATTQASAARIQTFLNRRALRRRMRALAERAPRLEGIGLTTTADAPPVAITGLVDIRSLAAHDRVVSVLLDGGADIGGERASRLRQAESSLAEGGVLLTLGTVSPLQVDAQALTRPAGLAGMNIFGPLAEAEIVELVRAPTTADEAVAIAVRYVRTIGKTAMLVGPGHASAMAPLLASHFTAARSLERSGNGKATIDAALRSSGWTRGPFELWETLRGDERVRRQLAAFGFNPHDEGLAGVADARSMSDEAIARNLTLAFALAACRLLEAGAVESAGDMDVAAQLCAGFPPGLGGPLQYLDWLGAKRAIALCAEADLGAAPVPPILRHMALDGLTFFSPA